ncbi:hypothetical protein BDB00DRAFT_791168 [Zychaea mexicana]|uniref:uncharacterized protein n=1 Tax=Zychaea mexicana TaxID=64656 RepID=UPI0022FF371F|nr:uncharacterized protein BDB00DRAFT_791168 [Zychaea mexicana]KAI9489384.1 hypothetical protein BDB00DRAFT_791168 [Zychaea mexicana]
MLGVTKYLLLEFFNYLDSDELKDLELKCRSYDSKAFRRMLSSSLRLRRSFVGRDYKVISQQAAVILNDLLHHGWSAKSEEKMEGLQAFFDCFRVHGEVMSLLFMSKIETKFSMYKLLLNKKMEELTAMIGVVDNFLIAQGNMTANSKMGNKPKLHILHHIVEGIECFATAIHFESEKGE